VATWLECEWSVDGASAEMASYLRRGGRPRVAVSPSDRTAWGVYHALADVPLAVPGEVSVISFDGSELGRWMRPTLASVALPFFEMGQEAVRILLDPAEKESVVMDMPLLPGDSMAAPFAAPLSGVERKG
jgi:LacI family transcriptional regulator